jgi:hypothetical protein
VWPPGVEAWGNSQSQFTRTEHVISWTYTLLRSFHFGQENPPLWLWCVPGTVRRTTGQRRTLLSQARRYGISSAPEPRPAPHGTNWRAARQRGEEETALSWRSGADPARVAGRFDRAGGANRPGPGVGRKRRDITAPTRPGSPDPLRFPTRSDRGARSRSCLFGDSARRPGDRSPRRSSKSGLWRIRQEVGVPAVLLLYYSSASVLHKGYSKSKSEDMQADFLLSTACGGRYADFV